MNPEEMQQKWSLLSAEIITGWQNVVFSIPRQVSEK
jgi:hypothetical protein